ncbi:MAG: DUF309 domain-containing protein [Limnochordaceae bacterium]|nr:DUF309 domain-containing protein [Limnochordaceae bacterium]
MVSSERAGKLQWPALGPPFDGALQSAVRLILERVGGIEHLLALYAAGSVVRGEGGPLSDLDLFVVHDHRWRQRVQVRLNGVPVEIFFNPPSQIRRTFEEERRRRRPSTAHMIATGFAMVEAGREARALREQARAMLDAGPPPLGPEEAVRMRYMAASLLEDAIDSQSTDPVSSLLLAARAVDGALRYRCAVAGRWEPRDKELATRTCEIDPALLQLLRAFHGAPDLASRIEAARRVVLRCTGVDGSFDWESPREFVVDPAWPEALVTFVDLFNTRRYWHAHEALEPEWRRTRSDFYRGLILYASAFVHAQRGNPSGVLHQLRKARERLARYAPSYLGLDVAAILEEAARVEARIAGQAGLPRGKELRAMMEWPSLHLDANRYAGTEPELAMPGDEPRS